MGNYTETFASELSPMITDADARRLIARVPYWYHPIEVRPGLVTPGSNAAPLVLAELDIAADCRGLRVLDLGTRDGFFAFELERRGADVTAVDYMDGRQTGFAVAASLLESRVTYLHRNVFELDPSELGTFDIVLFLGLIYHLPDPLAALALVRRLCHGTMCLESHVADAELAEAGLTPSADTLLMRFYPGRALNGDPTNFWGPTTACLEAMVRESGFVVSGTRNLGNRAVLNCRVVEGTEAERQGTLARAGRF